MRCSIDGFHSIGAISTLTLSPYTLKTGPTSSDIYKEGGENVSLTNAFLSTEFNSLQ